MSDLRCGDGGTMPLHWPPGPALGRGLKAHGTAASPSSGAVSSLIPLFIQPHRRQVLVNEVARADLPALDIGLVRYDPVPP